MYKTIPKDYIFKVKPFEHQIEGIEYGLNHDKWLLADSMGLGKSKTVIEIANIKKVKHCLIICCENGLKWNWQKQIRIHSNEEGFILGQYQGHNGLVIGSNQKRLDDLNRINQLPRFIITNIDTLKYRFPTGEKVERKVKGRLKLVDRYSYPIVDKLRELCDSGEIEMIAVDEFHMVRNEDTEQAKQILKIQASIQIAITGTPVINAPLDVFVALKWLGYENRSFGTFKYRYCRFGGYNGREIIGYRHLDEISESLDTVMLRRTKEETIDLPDKVFVDEYVEMNKKQAVIYNEVKGNLLKDIDRIKKSSNPLTEIVRLRQATGFTGILSSDIKESAKLDRAEELVEEAVKNDQKVVIFSNWTEITDELLKRLDKYNSATITGKVKDSEVFYQEQKFQTDDTCKVIIGTIKKMGKGYDLTEGEIVLFIDEPWDMETKKQAIDRCHRIGTKHKLTIYTLLTRNTIDERVNCVAEKKGEMSNILIDGTNKMDKTALINYLIT